MDKLTDTQQLLLTTAAARPDGSLLPPCDLLGDLSETVRKTIRALLRRGLAEEFDGEGAMTDQLWRSEGDRQVGLRITRAGRVAIGLDPVASQGKVVDRLTSTEGVQPQTKRALVIEMLQRPGGATLAALIDATGWLPHTTRAALTGLRKKGHVITASKSNGVSVYRILPAA